jgi:hypothetical protein
MKRLSLNLHFFLTAHLRPACRPESGSKKMHFLNKKDVRLQRRLLLYISNKKDCRKDQLASYYKYKKDCRKDRARAIIRSR